MRPPLPKLEPSTCLGTIRSSAPRNSSLPFLIYECGAFTTTAMLRRLTAAHFSHASDALLRLKIHNVDLS
jgi:hypothetical protein